MKMSDEIGSLILDLQGLQVTAEEKDLLQHPLVGGVILFTRNYDHPGQLKELCAAIRSARQKPLLIMVDQEGGRVQRFRNQFFPLPSLAFFGEWYDKNPTLALELAKTAAWLMSAEVLNAGIDFSIAPVIDINKGLSSAIGTRAFHAESDVIYRLAHAYIEGMNEAGMTATIKHFPGHGSVQADSHHDIPVDTRELQAILEDDLQPFIQLIRDGVPSILAAHIIYPQIDKHQVSFSKRWLQDILRTQLGFQGVILSDDLNMQGANISSDYSDRVIAAREAGCDFALVCNNRDGVIQVLDRLPYEQHQVSADKWRIMAADFSRQQNNVDRLTLSKHFLQTHIDTLHSLPLTNTQ